MTRLIRALALALFAVLAVAATGNWNATTTLTAGGHVLGNPAAKVKVIAFESYTCPHCAHFEEQSSGAIKLGWIQPGKVSLEVRHIIRDPIDLTAAMLANCGTKDKFFRNHAMFFQSQDTWIGKAQAATEAQKQRWQSGAYATRWQAIASDLGFYDMMVSHGYTRTQVTQCLTEPAARAIVEASEGNGTTYGVNSTPSFALNGKTLDGVHSWEQLQAAVTPQIK